MKGPGSATVKQHSLSEAPRGRETLIEQTPHNYE